MPSFFNYFKLVDLSDCVLIIPSISVGNIPQLTIDLIINTYSLEKVASIWHPAIIPTVCLNPYDSNSSDISTACELYFNSNIKVACLQLRSTLDSKMARLFFEDLYNNVKEVNLKKVVILSSGFDYELHNIKTERFYYLDNNTEENNLRNIPTVRQLETNFNGKYIVNGAGFAIYLYSVMSQSLKCVMLGKYISEGDNRPDAYAVFDKLLHLLDLQKWSKKMKYPASWEAIFGGPPPIGIY